MNRLGAPPRGKSGAILNTVIELTGKEIFMHDLLIAIGVARTTFYRQLSQGTWPGFKYHQVVALFAACDINPVTFAWEHGGADTDSLDDWVMSCYLQKTNAVTASVEILNNAIKKVSG